MEFDHVLFSSLTLLIVMLNGVRGASTYRFRGSKRSLRGVSLFITIVTLAYRGGVASYPLSPHGQMPLRVYPPHQSRCLVTLNASKREQKFRSLMTDLTKYSDSEMEAIRSSRVRSIMYGAKAASMNPKVVDAFVVLYEDLAPLRIAGNMIFNYLTSNIAKSIEVSAKHSLWEGVVVVVLISSSRMSKS